MGVVKRLLESRDPGVKFNSRSQDETLALSSFEFSIRTVMRDTEIRNQ